MDKNILDEKELLAKGFSVKQINCLKLIENNRANLIVSLNNANDLTVEDIKFLNSMLDHKTLAKEDFKAMVSAVVQYHELAHIPTEFYFPGLYLKFASSIPEFGPLESIKLYNVALEYAGTNGNDANIFYNILINAARENRDISFLVHSSISIIEVYCAIDIELFNILKDNNIVVENSRDVNKIASLIKLHMEQKPSFSLEEMLSKLDVKNLSKILSVVESGYVSLQKVFDGSIPESLILALSNHKFEDKVNFDDCIDFFNNHNEFLLQNDNLGKLCIDIIRMDELKKYVPLLEDEVETFSSIEIKTLESVISCIQYRHRSEMNMPKTNFDILFDTRYSPKQKALLMSDIFVYQDDERISNYLSETFSEEQIIFLRNELHSGNDIKRACNASYNIEHMRHVIFYETKGISFATEEEYDENYVQDKNKDYDILIKLLKKIDAVSSSSNKRETIVGLLIQIDSIAKRYDATINLDDIIRFYEGNQYIDEPKLLDVVLLAAKNKLDLTKLLSASPNPYILEKIAKEAIEIGNLDVTINNNTKDHEER